MNTTIETNEQPIKETWIKVVFALPNPYSDKPLWVDTSRLTLNNKNLDSSLRDTLSKLNDIKNMCVTKPKEYAEKYGRSLLSVVKEMFPDSQAHMLKVWSLEEERHAKVKLMCENVMSVTGFRGNIRVEQAQTKGIWTINWAESNSQDDSGIEAGKGAEIASTMEPLD